MMLAGVLLTFCVATVVFSSPQANHDFVQEHGVTISPVSIVSDHLDARDDQLSLRILSLGASITWGYLSSTGNGCVAIFFFTSLIIILFVPILLLTKD